MKTPAEIREFLAMMAERDKQLEKQLREEIESHFPSDMHIPDFKTCKRSPPVNCRCAVEPVRKEQS